MVFWLAVLIGALFAWIAVRIGFFATWTMFFHAVFSAYIALFLAPTAIDYLPVVTTIPDYGYALTVLSVALATLFLSFGTCYVCISGQLQMEFPRIFDTTVAGFLGFLCGFFIWSFLALIFSLTPLSQNALAKNLGLNAESQQTNTAYVCWWCNRLHGLLAPLCDETTGQDAVALLRAKAAPPVEKDKAPPTALANASTTSGTASAETKPEIEKTPMPQDGNLANNTGENKKHTAPKPEPVITNESVEQELARRRVKLHSAAALRDAIANPEIRIIELADNCSAGQFTPEQTTMLLDWVSKGGFLWVRNDVLTLFGLNYSKLPKRHQTLSCAVSQAVGVAMIATVCKRVELSPSASGTVCIQKSRGSLPLLSIDDNTSDEIGITCWSLTPYGKGWITDPKPLSMTRDDSRLFWENFCRFCLGKESVESVQQETPHSFAETPKPRLPTTPRDAQFIFDDKPRLPSPVTPERPVEPRGEFSGTWRSSGGAQFKIEDDGPTLSVVLITSDALETFSGRLNRRNGRMYEGVVDVTFRADPTHPYPVNIAVMASDAGRLSLRCENWPRFDYRGRLSGKGVLRENWTRAGEVPHNKSPIFSEERLPPKLPW